MTSQLQNDVAEYIGHFRAEHEKIVGVGDRLHRKLLIVSMLSALGEGRYPNLLVPDKFTNLIEEYSDWAHAARVSISQLQMRIVKHGWTPPKLTKSFAQEASRLYEDWRQLHNPSAIVGLGDDPNPADILPNSPTAKEKTLVNDMRHSSLLYIYRCKLVHEFREPGHGFEFDQREATPYYHSMMADIADQTTTMELVYPTQWFVDLPLPILTRLETYYVSSCTNPYGSYSFGSPW